MRCTVLTLVAACVPLAGCGLSFAGDSNQLAIRPIDSGAIDRDSAGSVALEEARQAMRGGNLATAMAAFRIAQRDPETAADAANGLGVAWATMGRDDLAERFFLDAIALAPQDRRYVANLERLYTDRTQAKAMAEARMAALATRIQPKPRTTLRSDVVSASGSSDRMVRVSKQEVMIGNPAPLAITRPSVSKPERTRVSAVVPRVETAAQDYPIRVAFPRRGDQLYPIRATLPAATSIAAARRTTAPAGTVKVAFQQASSRNGYPLRVQLPNSKSAAR